MNKKLFNFDLALETFCSNPLFDDYENWVIKDNPYRRPIGHKKSKIINFEEPLEKDNYFSYSSLIAHRMLCNIYHSDLVFLPKNSYPSIKHDLDLFYSEDTKVTGQVIRPVLEHHVFSFLEDEIDVTGHWTHDSLKTYFLSLPEKQEDFPSKLVEAILSSKNSKRAAIFLLIQLASDFLSEASGMARNIMGNFGEVQSDLFKILIDEYGYGVHTTKHSTLYEKLLRTHNLDDCPHAYWQYYLTSSFIVPNYVHYVSLDHRNFFRYVGALYYAETTYPFACKHLSKMLKELFGTNTETQYFDEHWHIDQHHSRMTYNNLVEPLLHKFGTYIIEDLIRGYEEFNLVSEMSDHDFIEQLHFIENIADYKQSTCTLDIDTILNPGHKSIKLKNERSVPCVNDTNTLLVVESGTLAITPCYDFELYLNPGERIVIPKNRVYATLVKSDECVYYTYEIGDSI